MKSLKELRKADLQNSIANNNNNNVIPKQQ